MSERYHSTQLPRRQDEAFQALVAVARRLQAPGGCAWDRAQSLDSLLPYLVEETWEVFEAIRRRRRRALSEELGDVLYTVLFLALVAERQGRFTLRQLLTATRRKMVRRHPHVFGTAPAPTPESAYQRWQASKRREGKRGHSPSEAFRRQLVASWDRRLTGTSRRPSGRSARSKTRWPTRG